MPSARYLLLVVSLFYYSVAHPLQRTFTATSKCSLRSNLTDAFFTGNSSAAQFGLREASTWMSLLAKLSAEESSSGQPHRLVLLGRHGQGYHNVAEAKYGTKAWDDYWSKQNGSGDGLVWGPDAKLTEHGKKQAARLHCRLTHEGPGIGAWYASPLSRALETSSILSDKHNTTILEDLREVSGVHTCDMRSTKSQISSRFPWALATGLTEADETWQSDIRESDKHVQARADGVARMLLSHSAQVISATTHSGFIRNFLKAVNHRETPIDTAGLIPLVLTYDCL
ncbi:histidine phosphatase superfamily [Protomyces lactucae-debilis]|uniref:Histidine phosphatase superfamily n=1 Tax=Protomyces lactucae-debilis TaxID=2754530 RepID=A0A1Y2FIF2_PROLT|nr:histidine phosphatase superfamily [Protomyces lactucae-debilis]ORY83026.1 histidine phosphatase superfamily [Protomyces lactucae-debilis]